MNEQLFFDRVAMEQEYLANGTYTFEELLKLSRKDRRVRNALVFYALSKPEYRVRFKLLSKRSLTVQRYKSALLEALVRVEKDYLYRDEVKAFASLIRKKYLGEGEEPKYNMGEYNVAVEMEKFFANVVNNLLNEQENTVEKQQYANNLLSNIDYSRLLVKSGEKAITKGRR